MIILVVCGIAATLFLTPSTVENKGSKNITDMANRTLQIPASVDRVVSTSPSMTTIMYMLAPEKITGLNFAWNQYEEKYIPNQYRNLPVVGGWFGSQTGSYEEFIASEPDLILDSVNEGNGDVAAVSISGIVGWIGLIIPLMTRMLVGPDNKILLPASLSLVQVSC